MDLAAKCLESQHEVQHECLRLCSMKTDSKKRANNQRIEDELGVDPDLDSVLLPPSLLSTHKPQAEVFSLAQEWREKVCLPPLSVKVEGSFFTA
jgi:hypothetical protein